MEHRFYIFNRPIPNLQNEVYGLMAISTDRTNCELQCLRNMQDLILEDEWGRGSDYASKWCEDHGGKRMGTESLGGDEMIEVWGYLSADGTVHQTIRDPYPPEFREDYNFEALDYGFIEVIGIVPLLMDFDGYRFINKKKYTEILGQSHNPQWTTFQTPIDEISENVSYPARQILGYDDYHEAKKRDRNGLGFHRNRLR